MIGLNFKKWNHSAGRVFTRDRFYYKGKHTPSVKIRFRYFKTDRQG